jgi:hypothetical protein
MTQKEAFSIIRQLGLTVKRTPAFDYRVAVPGAPEAAAYYASDLDEAVDAARAIVAAQLKRA